MYQWQISVALNRKFLFRTDWKSFYTIEEAERAWAEILKRFPNKEGYSCIMTRRTTTRDIVKAHAQ